jgi:peptidylamidoglycolate lyase
MQVIPQKAVLTSSLLIGFLIAGTSLAEVKHETGPGDTYAVVHGWPRLPEGRILGRAAGVEVDSHNHVLVYHGAGREWTDPFPKEPIPGETVALFDGSNGELLAEWGRDLFIMPHGLSVDEQDNVWLTDVGRHQVFKFSHDGELLLTLGTEGVTGDDARHFNLPTDVAVLPDGSFYVSDGYENSRVVKFSAEGEFLFQWGTKGSGPGQFDLPHGIAIDAGGNVYVADRGNARIQVFDALGKHITQWKSPALGRPYGIALDGMNAAFVVDGGDQPEQPPDRSRAFRLGLDGSIEAEFGRYGNYDGQFLLGHDIAVAADGAVFVVDVLGARVQKFVLQH